MSSNTIYCSYLTCKKTISTANIDKHYNTKSCLSGLTQKQKLLECQYCKLDFSSLTASERANHSRWCPENPRSLVDRKAASERFTHDANPSHKSIQRMKAGVAKAHADGKYVNASKKMLETKRANKSTPTKESNPEWYASICKAHQSATHQRVCKRTHEFTDKRGRKFKFDSSWEDALANRLDTLNLDWDRPGPIEYELDGKVKRYFPDFYIPSLDVYLDPKNPYVRMQQARKLEIVSKMINLTILTSLEACVNFSI